MLDQRRRVREDVVGRDRGDNDGIQVASVDSRLRQGLFRRTDRHGRRSLVRGGDAAFLHAGACADPLVVGVDELLKVGVGPSFFRDVGASPGDSYAHIWYPSAAVRH